MKKHSIHRSAPSLCQTARTGASTSLGEHSVDQESMQLAEEWGARKRASLHVTDLWSRRLLKQFLVKTGLGEAQTQLERKKRSSILVPIGSPLSHNPLPLRILRGLRHSTDLRRQADTDRKATGRLDDLMATVDEMQQLNARSRKHLSHVYSQFLQSKHRTDRL